MARTAARLTLLALAALAGTARGAPPDQPDGATPLPEPPAAALASITAKDALAYVTHLASDKLSGRGSGFEGADLACRYLVEKATEFGLEPMGPPAPTGKSRAYTQPFEIRCVPFPGQGPTDEAKGQVATTHNVIGAVRGSDETLREEWVVLSAHYDHVGRKKKKVWNGADDNASGTSALLEVAQAFALKDAPRPRRSLLFLWVSAEERGLLGSKFFTDNPTVPFGQIVCNLNIDMVGRNKPKEMDVYGNATSPELDSAHLEAAARSGFTFLPRTGSIFMRSDQVNFYEKNVPCLFWTSGLHKDYHTPNDVASRIDEAKVARAATHAYLTAWIVACRPERPTFRKMDKSLSAGALGAVLDMVSPEDVPDAKVAEGKGICLVRSVMEDSPASEAKLQPNDFILEVGDDPLPDDDPVGFVEKRMTEAKDANKKVSLRVLRGTKALRVSVKF